MLRLLFLSNFFFALWAHGSCPLKDGDLVFIKSQSSQAKLLKLTTGSDWTHVGMAFKKASGWEIIEAVQPVKWTSLYSFIRRSTNLSFDVRRATFPFNASKVKSYAEEKLGIDYDLIFAWDNARWYCTELVWKAYKKAANEELGVLENIGDLKNIDHSLIKAEAKKRFSSYGIPYNHEKWKEEKIITPIQMMNASNLEKIGDQRDAVEFEACLK